MIKVINWHVRAHSETITKQPQNFILQGY